MLRFYRIKWVVALVFGLITIKAQWSFAQCSITNLNPTYCIDDPAVAMTGGTNYYGPGVSGSTFTPLNAGAGTHRIYSSTGVATSYSVSTSGTFNPLPTGSAVTFPSLPGDEGSGLLPIGFTFNFFGTDYTDLTVDANGYVMFGTATSASVNQALPNIIDPDNLIAGAWDNLDITAGGTISTSLVGTSPTQTFIIDFNAVRHFASAQTVTFQIQLHESTNIIEIHSQDIQAGAGGITQGIENDNGTSAYTLPGRNNALWTASNDYVAFIPSCVDVRTVIVNPTPLTSSSVSAPPSVCPGTGAPVTITTSQAGILYQLQESIGSVPLSSFFAGNGGPLIITSNTLAASTDIKVYALNSSTGCDEYLGGAIPTVVTVAPDLVGPQIIAQPASSVVCETGTTSFTVDPGLTTAPTFQWQVSTDAGVTYSNVTNTGIYTGALTATLNLTGTTAANNGYLYRVIVGGTCTPPVTSNAAPLTVNQVPFINTQPATQTICEGSNVTFAVGAVGSGLTYQWQKGGVDIAGQTSSSLTLSAITGTAAGNYTVIVKGTCDATGITSSIAALTVNEVPEITLQPTNSLVCEGINTSFIVNAGVTTTPTYQWQVSTNSGVSYSNLSNTGIYSGVLTSSLSLTAPPFTNNGYLYRVIVSGACAPSVTSNGAVLSVNQAPVINTQPATQAACEGSNVTLTVGAAGAGLTYQWQKGGVDLSGETASSLTLSSVATATAGNYTVIVKGTCNVTGVTSAVAVLTVNEGPEITGQPANSIICQGTNTTFTVNPGVTTTPGYQWQVSTNGGVSYSNVTNIGIYTGATTATLTLTGTPLGNNGYIYRVIVSGTCTPSVTSNGAVLNVNQAPVINTQPATQAACEGSNVTLTVGAAGAGLTYQWQKGGVDLSGETASSLTLSSIATATAGNYTVIVKGTCNVTGVTSAVAVLTVNEGPEITGQPANSIICQGTNTTFTVNPGVTTTPGYQWQVSTNGGVSYSNVTNVGIYTGATTATLTLTGTPLGNNGYLYRVIVSGTCTPPVVSNGAVLNVNQLPVINTQPATQIACEGSNVTFTVAAAGAGLTYQWQKGGVDIGGQTSASLTLSTITAAAAGNYTVVVKGTCDATGVTSAVASLTVNETPEITLQPTNSVVCEGINTSFTVNAGATTVPTYQWQVSINGGVSYSNLADGGIYSGVLTSALSLTAPSFANNGYLYRVAVGGTCTPPVISNGAVLSVNQAPVINTQPVTQAACEGNNVTLTVGAAGTGLTYQWQKGGVDLVGETASSLTLSSIAAATAGNYTVIVKGTCDVTGVASAIATLTVNERPEITGQPGNRIICQGANTTFTVNAGVTTAPTYQWQVSTNSGVSYTNVTNTGIYTGALTATLTLTGAPLGNNGYLYRVIVSGTCTPPVTSNGGLLSVNQAPVINTQPITQTVCEGSNVTLTVGAVGAGLTYQWRKAGIDISGETASSLILTSVTATEAGNYTVLVKGTCNATGVTSAVAVVSVNELPEITAQPTNSLICEGANTSFTVNAGVTTAPTYQWQISTNGGVSYINVINAGIYTGASTATLTLTGAPLTNNGYLYRVIVGGTCAPPVASNGALLNVNQAPVINTQPITQIVCEGNNMVFTVGAVGTGLTYQWQKGGIDLSGETASTLTLNSVVAATAGNYTVIVRGTCDATGVTSSVASLTVNETPEITVQPVTSTICEGANTTFTVNAGVTTAPSYQWQVSINGGVTYGNISNTGIYTGALTSTLSLTGAPLANNGYLYRVVVGGTCTPTVVSNGAVLSVNQSPVINTQPITQTVCENTNVTFTVGAVGTGLTYQWQKGGVNIAGETASSLTLTSVTAASAGNYTVIVRGTCNVTGVTSAIATLTINEIPEITLQPTNSIICEAANTSFTVSAGITTAPTYQWQISTNSGVSYTNLTNTGIYTGALTATLNLSNVPLSNNGFLYRVIVGGTCSPAVVSDGALLNVYQAPIINTQPITQTVCENSIVLFSVVATGTGLTYQWRENGNPISNGGVYSGATTSTLTLTGVPLGFSTNVYSVQIIATCATIVSGNATLTVNKIPNALAADVSICSGQTTNITITNPNAVPTTTFTWTIQSSANVSGASAGSGTLIAQTLVSTDGVNSGTVTYLIQPSAGGCNGTTYAVTASVTAIPNASASPQTICSGNSTSVAITNPNGVVGTSFNWVVFSSSNVSGAIAGSGSTISQVLTSTDGVNSGTVTYRITPTANGCPGSSIDVTVTVSPKPVITNTSTDLIQEICSGTTLSFLPTASIGATTFTWTSSVIGTLSGVSASGSGAITNTPVNSTNSNAVIIYTITPAISSCSGNPVNFVVTVRPVTTASALPQIICSGQSTSVAITNPNAVSGTTYTWTVASTNVTGAVAGSGSTITQVLTSTDGLTNGSVTYTITPSASGCPGPTYPVTVTVKPVPVMTNTPVSLSQQICSGESLNFIPTSTISGATYSWTSTTTGPIVPASVSASGSGSIVNTPQNNGNVSGTVTYRIIPAFNGCDGLPVDYVVTVKPLPSATASNVIICSGSMAVINILPSPQNVTGTTFDWTAAPSGNVTGSTNGNGSTISQVLSTTNASIGTVIYTITPTANACSGPASTVTVTINPVATVNAGIDFAVCEPLTIPISGTIGGSATAAAWTLVAGNGTISGSTVTGSTITATYTVAPTDIDGSVRFLLSTNDPDAGGPCSIVTDELIVAVNRRPRLTLPTDYTVCEPSSIGLFGTLSGSATSGLWSIISGNGSLSASSVTGLDVTANYSVPVSDVTNTLRFRLTTNDPDGFGPCVAEFAEIGITVNESAKINAGIDKVVCEDQPVSLNAVASGTTTSVLWSGGSGGAQFSPVNNVNSSYALTPADIAATQILLNVTTNDPDGAGPCTQVSDQILIKINKLPAIFFSGLETSYAENSGTDNLDGFPLGGVFTGPGILAGTNIFNPANAGFGIITVRYTYTDPSTTCSNYVERTTIVNPVTNVDFFILEYPRPSANGSLQICAEQGNLTLIGIPQASEGYFPTNFRAISPELTSRISFDNSDSNWKLNSDGLASGTFQLQYIFTNEFNATDTLTKDLIVYSAPDANIVLGNKCIEDIVTFEENSNVPDGSSTIVNWNWFYDEGSNGSNGPTPEPTYRYENPGLKNISLEVTTAQGCRNREQATIIIGDPPKANFSWSAYCKGDVTQFKDASQSAFGTINQYLWDFGDGQSATDKDPGHTYSNFAVYDVKLTITTDAGCVSDTTHQVYILDRRTPLSEAAYTANFENGPGTWVAVASQNTDNNSWVFGQPNGLVINSANSGSNAWWTGANDKSYYNNEASFVIGPCLNLTELERPMISLKYWVDTQEGFDGSVVQYSTDGGATWETIGDAEGGGLNWYNSRNLPGQPGGKSNFAWSATNTDWKDGRYNLDQIPVALRDVVIFRIAFGSNDDNRSDRVLNGFAFDDIYIGEKNRNVLVEHFTTTVSNPSNLATEDLNNLYRDQFTTKEASDFILVEYHMSSALGVSNTLRDPINTDNPEDPNARALLYGVSQPPNTLMDGIRGDYFGTIFNGSYARVTKREVDRRALEDPTFSIKIDTVPGALNDTQLKFKITYTYIDSTKPLTTPVTLHAALIERGISTLAKGNVVRKLLLEREGKTLNRSWAYGESEVVEVDYPLDVPIAHPDSLYILGFIQDKRDELGTETVKLSKRIMQSTIVKASRKKGITIVGVEDDPKISELNELSLYPNPASKFLNIMTDAPLSRKYTWQLIDQRGISVMSGDLNQDFTDGPQSIDVSQLANGIYFMAIQTGDNSIVYRKIAVMNHN